MARRDHRQTLLKNGFIEINIFTLVGHKMSFNLAEKTIKALAKSKMMNYGEIWDIVCEFRSVLTEDEHERLEELLDSMYHPVDEPSTVAVDRAWERLVYHHETSKKFTICEMYHYAHDPKKPGWFTSALSLRVRAYLAERVHYNARGLLGEISRAIPRLYALGEKIRNGEYFTHLGPGDEYTTDPKLDVDYAAVVVKQYRYNMEDIEKDSEHPDYHNLAEIRLALADAEKAVAFCMYVYVAL